eukprot:1103458-Rhodomonas_salina.1
MCIRDRVRSPTSLPPSAISLRDHTLPPYATPRQVMVVRYAGTERGYGGTERGYGGYGGTEIGYGGTEIGYGGTERGYGGTEIGYGGTEIGYGGTRAGGHPAHCSPVSL